MVILLCLLLICTWNNSIVRAVSEEKVVFLTFDDGPSTNNSKRILQILKDNNVKGTFFVVGSNIINCPNIVQELINSGMSLYPHCNNHIYKDLYSNKENYFNDLQGCIETINSMNSNNNYSFVRMPGGSSNTICSSDVLSEIKIGLYNGNNYYVDWNVDIGDAAEEKPSSQKLVDNFKKYSGTYRIEVVLMHDLNTKESTIEALTYIINEYKAMGYKFKTLDEINEDEINYLIKIGVINRK